MACISSYFKVSGTVLIQPSWQDLPHFTCNNLLSFSRGSAKDYLVMTSTSIYFMTTWLVR